MGRRMDRLSQALEKRALRLSRFRPDIQAASLRQYLDSAQDRLKRAMERCLTQAEGRLALLAQRLQGCSPLEKLTKGFALVTKEDGSRLRSALEAKPGEDLTLWLSDGAVTAEVKEIRPGREELWKNR